MATHNTVYTSCGFQSNLQVQFPLARFVTGDKFAATQSGTNATHTVTTHFEKDNK